MDLPGSVRLAARLGLSVALRPRLAGDELELQVQQVRLGGLPLPAGWLVRLLADGLPAGGPVSADPGAAALRLSLKQVLPAGLRIASVKLEGGVLALRLAGGDG
jgi:hypothetical protein